MMALTSRPGEPDQQPIDDYHVDRGVGETTRLAAHHLVAVVNALLLIILAAVSFALFWIVATMLQIV